MSITSGFYNSLNNDRRYNAEQMSSIFNGIINDGVFSGVGTAFTVSAATGTDITVGVGRCWFNGKWLYNDTLMTISADAAEVVLDRIDAVVIEIDTSEFTRAGNIKIVKGTPGSNPSRPGMANTEDVHQHPLAYIYRAGASLAITQADITSMIGTSSCPYVTGILQVQNIDNIVAQWQAQWNVWYTSTTTDGASDFAQWMAENELDFNSWFADLQAVLDGDVATTLASQILDLQNRFLTLATDSAVYEDLQDSSNDDVEDSSGNVIEGRTVLGGGSGDGDTHVTYGSVETRKISITMPVDSWISSTDYYTQVVEVMYATPNTLVELQPSTSQIMQLINDSVSVLTINNTDGVFTAVAVGSCPTASMTIQATITEVL